MMIDSFSVIFTIYILDRCGKIQLIDDFCFIFHENCDISLVLSLFLLVLFLVCFLIFSTRFFLIFYSFFFVFFFISFPQQNGYCKTYFGNIVFNKWHLRFKYNFFPIWNKWVFRFLLKKSSRKRYEFFSI